MEAKIFNQSGDEVGIIQLAEYIFGIEPNMPVMHQAMVRQQANARLGTSNTLRRGEVQGSTRKLYKQKGTGRARAGSIRAPNRKGGGVAHGPHPRSYHKDMPRKMRRLAVRSALSAKFAADEIRFVDGWSFERPRTKDFLNSLSSLQSRWQDADRARSKGCGCSEIGQQSGRRQNLDGALSECDRSAEFRYSRDFARGRRRDRELSRPGRQRYRRRHGGY